jgi:hypothetical protein
MIWSSPFEVDIKQVVLHKLKVAVNYRLPAHILANANLINYADETANTMIVQLKTLVTAGHWTEKINDSTKIEKIPQTWFDHFRIRFFPKFLTKRYPVKYRTIFTTSGTINNYWVFPEIPPHPDKNLSDFIMAYTSQKGRY